MAKEHSSGERKRARSPAALLLVDVINPFEFVGAENLLRETRHVVPAIVRTRAAFDRRGLPSIYCNDNFGQWRSDFQAVVERCVESRRGGADIVAALMPRPDDYFVLKPKHSAFHATPLVQLLASLEVKRVYVVGIAADACVSDTVVGAHMEEFHVSLVTDAVASESKGRCRRAIDQLLERKVARGIQSANVLRSL
jgi:nicotinamidase-related amidase